MCSARLALPAAAAPGPQNESAACDDSKHCCHGRCNHAGRHPTPACCCCACHSGFSELLHSTLMHTSSTKTDPWTLSDLALLLPLQSKCMHTLGAGHARDLGSRDAPRPPDPKADAIICMADFMLCARGSHIPLGKTHSPSRTYMEWDCPGAHHLTPPPYMWQ